VLLDARALPSDAEDGAADDTAGAEVAEDAGSAGAAAAAGVVVLLAAGATAGWAATIGWGSGNAGGGITVRRPVLLPLDART
jgi:hypothetical protein